MIVGRKVPSVTFRTRIRDEAVGGPNPYRWQDMTSADYFAGKRVILFSLPGAFTPTCSTYQLPDFEKLAGEFKAQGIDAIYCISVNDAFVMYQWGQNLGLSKIKLLPDGNGDFTRRMGMLIDKRHLGFGMRSWRYAMVIDDNQITHWFEEPGINDVGSDSDPYGETAPEHILGVLTGQKELAGAA